MNENGETKNKGKYTEQELRLRGVGEFHASQTQGWATKLSTYHDEEVKRAFMALKRSFRLLATDCDNYVYHEIAHQLSELMIDTFLLKRSKGLDVSVPGPLVPVNALQSVPARAKADLGILQATAVKSDFAKWDGKIDTVSDINWIYNHLMVADVKPGDAPSPGAWAHLQYHRSSTEAMAEFFTKVYPRLIPSKSVIQKMEDKAHDDGRTTFSLLDRLLEECKGSPEQVPVLQLGDREHSGLQNEAGQSAVPEEVS